MKTTWPTRICHAEPKAWAPRVWARPRMTPPSSVPQAGAHASDDDRLEREDEAVATEQRVERGADAHHHAADG